MAVGSGAARGRCPEVRPTASTVSVLGSLCFAEHFVTLPIQRHWL